MNSNFHKQILIGGLAGLLVFVLVYVFLGGKRDDLSALKGANTALKQDVDRGYALKDIYEKLRIKVAQHEKEIEELVSIMPTDTDRGEIPYRIKKLADASGIEQVSFSLLPPIAKDYYTEFPVQFTFRAGYHTLGQFTSLLSGYGKIINLTDLQMKRDTTNPLYPVSVTCKVSAFVYNPAKPAAAPVPAGAARKPASPVKKDSGD
ncbi:MAG: type 4a pilus biogenesis protein PilO [Holophaga sp.]|jgi:Tfp pilus assembly protein PilO